MLLKQGPLKNRRWHSETVVKCTASVGELGEAVKAIQDHAVRVGLGARGYPKSCHCTQCPGLRIPIRQRSIRLLGRGDVQ